MGIVQDIEAKGIDEGVATLADSWKFVVETYEGELVSLSMGPVSWAEMLADDDGVLAVASTPESRIYEDVHSMIRQRLEEVGEDGDFNVDVSEIADDIKNEAVAAVERLGIGPSDDFVCDASW